MPGHRPNPASKKFLKDTPPGKDVTRLLNELQDLNDRSLVIVGGALFAESFRRFLESRMRKGMRPGDRNRMLNPSQGGFLSTFDAQVRLAYALNWIDDEFFEDALIIQAIRNVFAHSFHDVTFSTAEIQADCRKLHLKMPPESTKTDSEKPIEFAWFRNWIYTQTYHFSYLTSLPPNMSQTNFDNLFQSPDEALAVVNQMMKGGGEYIESQYGVSLHK